MTMPTDSDQVPPQPTLLESTRSELERVGTQLKEVRLLVEQSLGEVEKLAKRNASITTQLHQLQSHFDTVPREDIRATYEAAQDAQQRMFTMRGQLEKLQSDQAHLERLSAVLTQMASLLEAAPQAAASPRPAVDDTQLQQIVEAQEEDRRWLSRQIHDGPAQSLSNFILQAEIVMRLMDRDPSSAREELANLKRSALTTFSQMRSFIFDLRPMMLDDLGLVPTVRRYVDAFKEETGLDVSVVITGTERRIEVLREVLLFRAIQELLHNVREHAKATQVKVTLDIGENQARAHVEDNGKGFELASLPGEGSKSKGLQTLKRRILQLGGTVDVESRPGEGTRVSLIIPCAPQAT